MAYQTLNTKFKPSVRPDSVVVDLTFGIKDYNPEFWEEEQSYWDTTDHGGPIFDINFEVSSQNS